MHKQDWIMFRKAASVYKKATSKGTAEDTSNLSGEKEENAR